MVIPDLLQSNLEQRLLRKLPLVTKVVRYVTAVSNFVIETRKVNVQNLTKTLKIVFDTQMTIPYPLLFAPMDRMLDIVCIAPGPTGF